MAIEVRPVTDAEYHEFRRVNSAAFGEDSSDEWIERSRPWVDLGRTLAAFDDGRIAGTANSFAFEIEVPGARLPLAGVSHVGVLPTHRRRGILTTLMQRQLEDVHARGEPLGALYASESAIYPRYGYGMSVQQESWRIEREHGALRDTASRPPGRVRLLSADEARDALPPVFERAVAGRPGMIPRTDWLWERDLRDQPEMREGASAFFFVAYEDGGRADEYAVYRVKSDWPDFVARNELRVRALVAATDDAHEALWRYLFGIDLVQEVVAEDRPVDDPLPWMLRDPRRLQRKVRDGLWVRLVDLPAALGRRCYSVPGSLVLDVRDATCPWNAGRWRLEGGPEGGRCEATNAPPDLAMDIEALAAAYLGGVRFAVLAAARRVEERTPGALGRADAMFVTPRAPWCQVFF